MFKGVYTALITPFKEGGIDWDALGRLLEDQVAAGIAGVVPCGTTGESATLSHDEHRSVIRFCVERIRKRIQVIAGTGSNATRESIELTRFARDAGADGALVITPYYNKPGQEGLVRHYTQIAEAVDLPVILYNVPGRTAVDMTADTVIRLARVKGIVAIKEATGNMERAAVIHQRCGSRMVLISGDDATFLPFLAVGGQGVISVSANIAPRHVNGVWLAWQQGDTVLARKRHEELLDLNRYLFCETNPIPVKAAAAMLGICSPEIRLPLTELSSEHRQIVRGAMDALGLSGAQRGHQG
ncbi:MAG: 4-hydroxy-tetrahydrodipicolinate synthase [Magnetococcales bacterium]|nr:4-hydroxy-tetrahydrodipicolinate synthase [Magnetococcales bacterium]MBF0151428.1 4-hydroxy-tetrahydrodipicolinate synthase [Magnetococcales bacterium]